MARFIQDRSASQGSAPGSAIFIGRQKMQNSVIQLIEYNENELSERTIDRLEDLLPSLKKPGLSWINIYGVHDALLMTQLGEMFSLSPLFLEDIMNTDQQPMYDDGEDYDGFILKSLRFDAQTRSIHADQVTLILGKGFVLTIQEQTARDFEPVRERIRLPQRRMRLNDADYLMYALLDTLVDQYIKVTESLGREIEAMTARLFEGDSKGLLKTLYSFKLEMNYLRKNVRPVKEIIQQVLRMENTLFQEQNKVYIRDLNDLIVQATEAIELYYNMTSDQLNIFHSNTSQRMNEVMKVLTVFAAIFIPLTFIAGVYGMNFNNIPELRLHYGYAYFWGLILIITTFLIWYFRRKKWF